MIVRLELTIDGEGIGRTYDVEDIDNVDWNDIIRDMGNVAIEAKEGHKIFDNETINQQ